MSRQLPGRPKAMPDSLWAEYVAAHEAALAKMQARGSVDDNYYDKLLRRRLGSLRYDLCLKYFLFRDMESPELHAALQQRESILNR